MLRCGCGKEEEDTYRKVKPATIGNVDVQYGKVAILSSIKVCYQVFVLWAMPLHKPSNKHQTKQLWMAVRNGNMVTRCSVPMASTAKIKVYIKAYWV